MSVSFRNQTGAGDDYVQGTATLFSYPFTINAWIKADTIIGTNMYVTLHNTTDNQRYSIGFASPLGRTRAAFQCFDTTLASATSTSDLTAGTWYMVTGVGTSATSRTVYVNGGSSATNTTSKTPTTPTRWLLGGSYGGGAIAPAAEGKVAEVAIWNVALTTDEILSLKSGVRSKYIRPQNLKLYLPLVRSYNDDTEATTAITSAGTNLAYADHPRRYG